MLPITDLYYGKHEYHCSRFLRIFLLQRSSIELLHRHYRCDPPCKFSDILIIHGFNIACTLTISSVNLKIYVVSIDLVILLRQGLLPEDTYATFFRVCTNVTHRYNLRSFLLQEEFIRFTGEPLMVIKDPDCVNCFVLIFRISLFEPHRHSPAITPDNCNSLVFI